MKNIYEIIWISLLVITLICILILLAFEVAKEMGIRVDDAADYDKKIAIWNVVPGNSPRSKLADMKIDYEQENLLLATANFLKAIAGKNYEDAEQTVDTFSYLYEIKRGYEKETYEDEPYIIPYLVENSEISVVVIPGGRIWV